MTGSEKGRETVLAEPTPELVAAQLLSDGNGQAPAVAPEPSASPRPAVTGDADEAWWAPEVAGDAPEAPLDAKVSWREATMRRFLRFGRLALVFSPTIAAFLYFVVISSDRYESEAQFIVRTAAKPETSIGGFGALLKMGGLVRSQDDAYSVQSYLGSREATRDLLAQLPIRDIYARPQADWLTRFPPPYMKDSDEDLYKYLAGMISVNINEISSITTLDVQAYKAEDALKIAQTLLQLAERKINSINARLQTDAVQFAEREVSAKQKDLITAQIAVTDFRNKEMMIDPGRSSLVVTEVISRLSQQLVQVESNLRETTAQSPQSPGIAPLANQRDALHDQIENERRKIAGNDSGLAEKLRLYEELTLQAGFAERALSSAQHALDSAREEARRQQLYLEMIVSPHLSDRATMPKRWHGLFTFAAANFLLVMMLWLIASGFSEHASEKEV